MHGHFREFCSCGSSDLTPRRNTSGPSKEALFLLRSGSDACGPKRRSMNPILLLQDIESYRSARQRFLSEGRVVLVARQCSFDAMVVAALFGESSRPFLVVLPDERRADRFHRDLHAFLPGTSVQYLPAPDFFVRQEQAISETMVERVRCLIRLAGGQPPVITVTYPAALLKKVPSETAFREAETVLRTGGEIRREGLLQKITGFGYRECEVVESPGDFARRGSIVDVFPPGESFPVRLEFFGNRIHSLRRFEVSGQISFERIGECRLFPLHEELVAYDRDSMIPDFSGKTSLFLAYPDAFEIGGFLDTIPSRIRKDFAGEDEPARWMERASLYVEEFTERLKGRPAVSCAVFPVAERFRLGHPSVWNPVEGERFVVFSGNVSQETRLKEVLAEKGISVEGMHFRQGPLSRGFFLAEANTSFLSNDELFLRYETRHVPARTPESAPLAGWDALKEGDYVVHYNEGIGRFAGMEKLVVDGREEEFIRLEYADGDRLFVPLDQVAFVHKYVGSREPVLSKLGSRNWLKIRERVREAIRDLASDLYRLYLERKKEEGTPFLPDEVLEKEFEESFIYRETPDQTRTIRETRKDLESGKITDRLICGDAGYGKTEVAMRACFKAVVSGRQAAVLVPTTVLALQHYCTFRERFADFPVRVEMLSRFVDAGEEARILRDLSEGRVDILIGTHRILQDDVRFRDLGLLVVDEEQRFGVTHKEKIKSVFRKVHVLTLTATPIPRTLYFSLSGLRDISIMETPPAGRMSVITYVGTYDSGLVRDAILREMDRGGQVFYLHNFIHDIERVRDRVRRIVPSARVEIAHGRMPARQIEEVMKRFSAGDSDVLVATTIVENGLDIPRANTLIVDGAHRFGLADLYQLRGRIGRYRWRAYAYFLVPGNIALPDDASNRLKVLQELTEPGSGLRVAMKDLEIRGAGNVLGREQSGFIEQVGFQLYCRFWSEVAGRISGRAFREPEETRFAARIPEDYVPTSSLRLWLYRRISEIGNEEEAAALMKELEDRFGPVPDEVKRLVRDAMERAGRKAAASV